MGAKVIIHTGAHLCACHKPPPAAIACTYIGQLIFSLEKSVVLGVVELFALHFVVYHLTMIHTQ